jgi:hypothetical protein
MTIDKFGSLSELERQLYLGLVLLRLELEPVLSRVKSHSTAEAVKLTHYSRTP